MLYVRVPGAWCRGCGGGSAGSPAPPCPAFHIYNIGVADPGSDSSEPYFIYAYNCSRSSYPFHIVTYYINASWTSYCLVIVIVVNQQQKGNYVSLLIKCA